MLGILLLLVLYSVFLLLIEKKIYDVLGLMPTQRRVLYFSAGFILAGILVLLNIAVESIICSIQWKLKSPVDFFIVGKTAWFYFISVFTEELIFRGILLYILLLKTKERTAILISSSLFGFYHWFSYEMFSAGVVPMLYVFLITGLAGYCWAFAFVKSKTILLPLGMHFGWNTINSLFRKAGPYGEALFIKTTALPLTDIPNLFLSLFTGIVPSILMYLGLYLYYTKKHEA